MFKKNVQKMKKVKQNDNVSFRKGFGQVRQMDADKVRDEIMSELGLTSRSSWFFRLNGVIEPKVSEAKAIEAVFGKYGVTDIWGGEL
jgi:hypothetical protein